MSEFCLVSPSPPLRDPPLDVCGSYWRLSIIKKTLVWKPNVWGMPQSRFDIDVLSVSWDMRKKTLISSTPNKVTSHKYIRPLFICDSIVLKCQPNVQICVSSAQHIYNISFFYILHLARCRGNALRQHEKCIKLSTAKVRTSRQQPCRWSPMVNQWKVVKRLFCSSWAEKKHTNHLAL